jgi:hypothetical protein
MSHVDQSKHPSLRHMNNGIQGKSRNDRFTWHIMSSTTVLGYTLHVLFFFPLKPAVPALCPAGISYRYITPINCIQRRLGWEAGYRTTLRYTRGLEYI